MQSSLLWLPKYYGTSWIGQQCFLLTSGILRNFTDCTTMLSFDFRHITKLHGLRNNGCQVPRSGQTRVASQQTYGPQTKLGYDNHIEIPVSEARWRWCNNVIWWWSNFGHGGWRVENMVLVGDEAAQRCWCGSVVCVRWVENIFKIQNEGKIVHIYSTIPRWCIGERILKLKKKNKLDWQKWPPIGQVSIF